MFSILLDQMSSYTSIFLDLEWFTKMFSKIQSGPVKCPLFTGSNVCIKFKYIYTSGFMQFKKKKKNLKPIQSKLPMAWGHLY